MAIGAGRSQLDPFSLLVRPCSLQLGTPMQGLTEALGNLQQHVAPPLQHGLELLNHLQTKANIVPTGCVR